MRVETPLVAKSAFPEKAGVVAPTALLETKSMSELVTGEDSSDDQPWRDAELLRTLYWDEWLSIRDISDRLDCNHKTVARWLDRHDIERRGEGHPAAHRELRDAENLRELYWDDYQSTAEIADRYDCSRRQISYWLDKHGIEIRDPGGDGDKHPWKRNDIPPEEVAELYTEVGLTAKEIGEQYDCAANTVLRILHENGVPVQEPTASGPDNGNWGGGRGMYHSVRSALGSTCWPVQRDRHLADECEMCGESADSLDLHHIVPVLAGGSNAEYNYMTLCRSCHNTVEARTREFADPVLLPE